MRRIWITRAEPGASATAARLAALGFEPVIAPLIAVRPLAADIDLAGIGALAFTSAAGVAAFAASSPARDLPVFAVGETTARAARDAGFRAVTSAAGDVAALAERILASRPRIAGMVLHAGAAAPAGDLTGDLARAGVAARFEAVYETVPAEPPSDLMERLDTLAAVLVHSPSAGRRLADVLTFAVPTLTAVCLSPAIAATLDGLAIGGIFTAALPDEDALLSLLAEQMNASNGDR